MGLLRGNPVPSVLCALTSREPPLGLAGRVLNVHFMESSIDDVTSFLDPRRAPRFCASGFCHTPHLGVPNVSASSSIDVWDPPKVEATDHQSFHSTGCFNCLVVTTFTSTGSSVMVHLQSSRLGVSPLLPRIQPSAAFPCPAIGHLRLLFRMTAVSSCALQSGRL